MASRSEPVRRRAAPPASAKDELLCRLLGLDPVEARPSTRLFDDLGLDSYDLVEIVEEMEARFGVRIDDGAFDEVVTVGDLVGVVSGALEGSRH